MESDDEEEEQEKAIEEQFILFIWKNRLIDLKAWYKTIENENFKTTEKFVIEALMKNVEEDEEYEEVKTEDVALKK